MSMSTATPLRFDEDRCYDALLSRDRRFDGQFIAAITSTGIYCRPSCPAPVRPKRKNVQVYATAAAAQLAGFRSCKRCRPDAAPGSPEWDQRGDLVGRAMRLIERGEVDRVGVAGVAAQLFVSERHLNRVLNEALGAGPIALARAQRTNLARILLETTPMSVTDTAFAAGFSSVRQFNDTMRAVYDRTPTEIRKAGGRTTSTTSGIELKLWQPAREPIDHEWMFGFLAGHGLPGISSGTTSSYERTMQLAGGSAHVEVAADTQNRAGVWTTFTLDNIADLADAIARIRRVFDLDADPHHIDEVLGVDPVIGPLRRTRPGVRIPGSVDGFEAAVGAVIGQQISVAGARTLLGRLVDVANNNAAPDDQKHFPSASALVELDLSNIGLTTARQRTLRALSDAVARDDVRLDSTVDRSETRAALLALPGIGPWTADVIAMRALGDTDVLLGGDLVIKRLLEANDIDPKNPTSTEHLAPWRSYVACTLWATRGLAESTSP